MRVVAALVLGLAVSFSWPGVARADDDLVVDLGGSTLEFRRVPKGSFVLGSQATEPGHEKDEEGPRPVTIAHELWVAKTPVTRGQFGRFVADTRYVTEAEKAQSGGFGWDGKQLVQKKDFTWRNPGFVQGDDHPVVLVTYGDANAFASWASRKSGKLVRLPTEAEWEYAARAGTTTPWYAAKNDEEALALGWFKTNAGAGTHPVGQKKANAFGLFDMEGDVYEWCRDLYAPSYPREPAIDPENTTQIGNDPPRRVLRGGSWIKEPKRGRSAARFKNAPGSRNADNGFRVVLLNDDLLAPGLGSDNDLGARAPLGAGSAATPATSAASAAAASAASNEPISWTLFAAPIAAAALVVAWMFGRRRGAAQTTAAGVTTTIASDGFFVSVPNAAAGSRLKYACIAAGIEVTDVIPLDGNDETFVYTGTRPSDVRVVEILAAATTTTPSHRAPPPLPAAAIGFTRPSKPPLPPRSTPSVIVALDDDDVAPSPPPVPPPPPSSSSTSLEPPRDPIEPLVPFVGLPRAY